MLNVEAFLCGGFFIAGKLAMLKQRQYEIILIEKILTRR
jgi:hypothetical protein